METKPQCHHVMDSGRRCQTPPLKGHVFCYFHRRLHATFVLPGHPEYVPPVLDSRHAIQIAMNHVYLALSKGLLERRLATTMLYNLQLIQTNLAKGLDPAPDSVEEISAPMQKVLHLDDGFDDVSVRDASPVAPLSTDTAVRRVPVNLGINEVEPEPEADPVKALENSNELAATPFNRFLPPEFVPELDIVTWRALLRDLPPKGEPGTPLQRYNCSRVLQILRYNGVRRRMAGVK